MKNIVLSILLIVPFFAIAQKDSTKRKTGFEEVLKKATFTEAFEAVEEEPKFPGGDEARKIFIQKNVVYPDSSLKYVRQGKVYVKFVVEADSSVSRVKALKYFDEEAAAEAVRVTKMMRWIPGKQKGKAVPVWVVMPIVFRIK